MKIDKKELSTIPNILSLIRLGSVPFYMFCIIFGYFKNIESLIYVGLGIFLLAASTDVFDGYIARKYNQVTETGKFLDPFCDKVMHITVLLSLVIIGYVHWIFIVLLALKELAMILFGVVLINNKIIIQANSIGKVASAIISAGVILSFFHKYVKSVDWVILGIGIALSYLAFVNYGLAVLNDLKRIRQNKKEAKQINSEGDLDG